MPDRITIDNQLERRIIIGMISSTQFLTRVLPIYREELLAIPYAQAVAEWCRDYHSRYGEAPARHIEDIYRAKMAESTLPEETMDSIADFLESCSQEFERGGDINVPYLLDQTERRFRARSLVAFADDVQAQVASGNLEDAEAAFARYRRVASPAGAAFWDPLNDIEATRRAFEDQAGQRVLCPLPGAAGKLLNQYFVRDSLVGILAPEKRGKTWVLAEIALRACWTRCNVALFECGDMSQDQIQRRISMRLSHRNDRMQYCGPTMKPVLDCKKNQLGECDLPDRACSACLRKGASGELCGPGESPPDYHPCHACQRSSPKDFIPAVWQMPINIGYLTWRHGWVAAQRLARIMAGQRLRASAHANNTISVRDICSILDTWEHFDGFIPDVIVIDYADILAPMDGRKEHRHQQNETWQALRGLSQARHCLVVTATQADADSYDRHHLSLSNFSEDKRKYGHVTAMLALNQTQEEKAANTMRVSVLLAREGEVDARSEVTVLQCLRAGQPCLASY